jgi:predicted enzyme related to lactoylglutathione lyase
MNVVRAKRGTHLKLNRYLLTAVLSVLLLSCTTTQGPDLAGMSFSDEPLIGKAIWHDLVTEDPAAAERFYEGLFGWSFQKTTATGGHAYSVARSGSVWVAGIIAVDPPTDGKTFSRWLPYFSVGDVDRAVETSVSAGGTVAATARNVPLGRVAAIVDREGAVIGLARSDIGDPDDSTTAAAPGRVIWTELLTNNVAAATEFYRRVIGFDVRTIERRGGKYRLLGNNGIDRAGLLENPVPDWTPIWLTYFGVKDAAAAAVRAEELGGQILVPVSPELREGTMAVVRDPTGALLVLQNLSE